MASHIELQNLEVTNETIYENIYFIEFGSTITLSDTLEIDISYIKNEQKKLIKSEIDFKTFLHSRIPKLNLDINESSQLYQKSLLDLQNKAKDGLVENIMEEEYRNSFFNSLFI